MVARPKIAPLLTVVGETASGKSAISLQLAQQLNGEIICADAWTVRRGLDIGTAKPTQAEQMIIKHHLLDIIEPDDKFNAAKFKELANKAIIEIYAKNKLPIMVGGSGLYIDSLLYNYGFLSSVDNDSREHLNKLNNDQLLDKLKSLDISIKGVDLSNKRRLIRLIETGGQKPTKHELRPNTLIIGIANEQAELKNKIIARVDQMLKVGLEDEVKRTYQKYGPDCEGLKAIGYIEWLDYIEGNISRLEVRDQIIKNTLNLAKKQRTWFKRNKCIHWLSTPFNLHSIVELMTTELII